MRGIGKTTGFSSNIVKFSLIGKLQLCAPKLVKVLFHDEVLHKKLSWKIRMEMRQGQDSKGFLGLQHVLLA